MNLEKVTSRISECSMVRETRAVLGRLKINSNKLLLKVSETEFHNSFIKLSDEGTVNFSFGNFE